LIVEAFTQLGQPQKVKLAYQHYLKYFPNEQSAQIGLIECLVAEKDLKGAVALLDNYELGLIESQYLDALERIYRGLDKIDPINLRVLEGLSRVCSALSKADDVTSLQSKILSLQGVSGKGVMALAQVQDESFDEPVSFADQASDETEFGEVSFLDSDSENDGFVGQYDSGTPVVAGAFEVPEEDVEIEVELEVDDDELEIPLEPENVSGENWLDAVDEIFDSIATKSRGVKFASGHDGADAQSHYDLGVAFREMGLFDEAINEFRQAAADSGRRLECLILQGACLREKGDLTNAEKVMKSLLQPGLGLEDASFVKYELALIYGECGKKDQLVELLTEIDRTNSGFRDVRARLDVIGRDQNTLDFSDDDLKGFDLK